MARPAKAGHIVAGIWIQEFGARPVTPKELIGEGAPFHGYTNVWALCVALERAGVHVTKKKVDRRSMVYSISTNEIIKFTGDYDG